MTREQIYAALIAIDGDHLLLPNAAVAEVLGNDALVPSLKTPPWLRGTCAWNSRQIPVLCFEQLAGAATAGDARRQRIVVLHSPGRHLPSGNLAVLSQGYPHLVTLNRAALESIPLRETDRDDLVLSRVRIASQQALIPDLETIEAEIARAQMVS